MPFLLQTIHKPRGAQGHPFHDDLLDVRVRHVLEKVLHSDLDDTQSVGWCLTNPTITVCLDGYTIGR